MTQQDDITQRMLTDADIEEIRQDWHCFFQSSTQGGVGVGVCIRDIERRVLSQVRAPVADERGDTALPSLPRSVTRHRDLGDLWDATAMHQYAVRYADLCRPWVAMQARAALASAPVAEPRLEWSAKALYDAIKDVLLNHRLSNWVDGDGESFPLVDHLCSKDAKTTESGEFEIALICDAIYNDVLTKSAPVAGEAQKPVATLDVIYPGCIEYTLTEAAQSLPVGKHACYAAPQASAEDVHNAALEKAARLMEQTGKRIAASDIRALKTQADRDGGQQRDGDVRDTALSNLIWAASERDKGNRIRQFDQFMDEARAAISSNAAKQGSRDE